MISSHYCTRRAADMNKQSSSSSAHGCQHPPKQPKMEKPGIAAWRPLDLTSVMGLVMDECHDHAVQVVEEHDQMEAQLGEGLLDTESVGDRLDMNCRSPTFLCTFSFRKISVASSRCCLSNILLRSRQRRPGQAVPGHFICVAGLTSSRSTATAAD